MAIPNEAMEVEDYERWEKGLPPKRKASPVIPEPEFPEIKNLLSFDDIPIDRFRRLVSAKRHLITNEDGVTFIGFDVTVELKEAKKKPGRPPVDDKKDEKDEERLVSGWMIESEWQKLFRHARENIDVLRISL
jgi:hypothetical protein